MVRRIGLYKSELCPSDAAASSALDFLLILPFSLTHTSSFWWGGRPGPDGTRRLYQITHDYLKHEKNLTNLIWTWNIQDFGTLLYDADAYNPGDEVSVGQTECSVNFNNYCSETKVSTYKYGHTHPTLPTFTLHSTGRSRRLTSTKASPDKSTTLWLESQETNLSPSVSAGTSLQLVAWQTKDYGPSLCRGLS